MKQSIERKKDKKIFLKGEKVNLCTKSNKQIIAISCIIMLVLAVLTVVGLIGNNRKQLGDIDLELARAMTYQQYEEGEEVVAGTKDCVQFSAFFLRDLTGDNIAEKIKGTCKETGKEDELFLEVKVLTEGRLENAVITINADNFYYNTAIVRDDQVKNNYIGINTNKIELKTLESGTQKLLSGKVRSGDYSQKAKILDALGKDTDKYTGESTVVLTGKYFPEEGDPVDIRKEYTLKVDWYGKAKCLIPEYYKSNSSNKYHEIALNNFSANTSEEIMINYTVGVEETAGELLLKKSYIEGTLPEVNGYLPTDVVISGVNVDYTYNKDTGAFTAYRNAELDEEGRVTSSAYSTVLNGNIYNEYMFIVKYPREVFEHSDSVDINMPIKAHYEGYNNQNEGVGDEREKFANPYQSNIVDDNILIRVYTLEKKNIEFNIEVGTIKSEPIWRYSILKSKPIKLYGGILDEEPDRYKEKWSVTIGNNNLASSGIIMKDSKNLLAGEDEAQSTDKFLKKNETAEEMGEIVKYAGIYISSYYNFLGEGGWIKVYDDSDDQDKLLIEFTKENVGEYNEQNPYYYPEGVSHIRIETSGTQGAAWFTAINIKELNDEKIIEKYPSKEQFDEINRIQGRIVGYLKTEEDGVESTQFINDREAIAYYEEESSVATIGASVKTISTQTTTGNQIVIHAVKNESNNEMGWLNGVFLVKLPPEIIYLKVNSIERSDYSVTIDNYEVYEEGGSYFIKIYTSNKEDKDYKLVIDCDITANPTITTADVKLDLYSTNELVQNYHFYAKDIYDVNNNGDRNELVNHWDDDLQLVSPSSLLTSSKASEYDDEESTAIAPRIAYVDKSQRQAKVSLDITNNYGGTISDIVIIGKIPFVGNKYTLNKRDLESQFSTTMQRTGIEVPETLNEYAKVYYSTEMNPTTNIDLQSNKWVKSEDVTEWKDIRSYIIVLENFEMPEDNNYIFSYKIDIPNGVDYNKTTYCTHAVYFSLNTANGKYQTNVESNKLGFMIAKQYDLEIVKRQVDTEKLIARATYSVTEEETGETRTAVTNEDGKLLIGGLYVDKKYKIKEIRTPEEYELNEEEIEIKAVTDEEGDNLSASILSGTAEISTLKENEKDWKVTLEVEDEVKARVKIIKKDRVTSSGLSKVQFRVTGPDKNTIIVTGTKGEVTLKGLHLGKEYTIEEIKANGYFMLSEQIKVVITKEGKDYQYQIKNGQTQIENEELVRDNEIPVLKLEIGNEPRETYKLEILKVQTGTIDGIVGAKFIIEGPGMDRPKYCTTDGDGYIAVEGLYVGANKEDAVEYTITETEAPLGYVKIQPIKFKVYKVEDEEELKVEIIQGKVRETGVYQNPEEEQLNEVSLMIEDDTVFKLVKKDGETGKLLPNVKFALYSIDLNTNEESFAKNVRGEELGKLETINDKEYRVLTTDTNGQITADLGEGKYKVVELETIEGYQFPEAEEERTYYFGIGHSEEEKIEIMDKWSDVSTIEGYPYGNYIVKTSDGGYLGCGSFSSESITLTKGDGQKITLKNNRKEGSYSDSAYIIKYNAERKIEWANCINQVDYGSPLVTETTDKGYAIAFQTYWSATGDITLSDGKTLTTYGNNDIAIVKYNDKGEILWCDLVGDVNNDDVRGISATKDGGVIIAGECGRNTKSNNSEVEIKREDTNNNSGILIKYDKDGKIDSYKQLPMQSAFGVTQAQDGYIVEGKFYYDITFQNGDTISCGGFSDNVVIKYDDKWNEIWYDQIGGDEQDGEVYNLKNHVIPTSDGCYFVVSETCCDNIELSNGDKLHGQERFDFIIKYNEDGKIEWSSSLLSSGIYDVKPTKDGGAIACSSNKDKGLIKIDKKGKQEWIISNDKLNLSNYATTVVEEDNGNYLIIGSGKSTELPSGTKLEITDSAVIFIEYDINVTPEVEDLNKINTIPEKVEYIADYATWLGDSGYDGGQCDEISTTVDGGYVASFSGMSSVFNVKLKDGTTKQLINSSNRWATVLIKYDKEGDAIWADILCSSVPDSWGNDAYRFHISATNDNGVIATGVYYSGNIKLNVNGEEKPVSYSGDWDVLVVKYDAEGNIEWFRTIEGWRRTNFRWSNTSR